jgi:methionyl-tRNA formyltransferase
MRVVFMGTPDFAVPALRALQQSHDVVGVFTRPDAVSGRGAARRPSAVKRAALDLGLSVHEPLTLRDPTVVEQLSELAPEVIVVAAYGALLPRDVLSVPQRGCINIHASLLPRWRGAAPIQWAILEGDTHAGVCIMRMEEGLDTGPYCRCASVDIAEKNTAELSAELAELGSRELMAALDLLQDDACRWVVQDEAGATYARKLAKTDVALGPDLSVVEALRRVRASSAQAPARARVAGKGVALTHAEAAACDATPGSVFSDGAGLFLGFSDGAVAALKVRPDGKSEMAGADWARGLRLEGDECWEGAL